MSANHSTPSIGKRIGEFLILAIYLAIDAIEIWPCSHFWALAAGFLGLLALILLDGGLSRLTAISILIVALVGCVITYLVVGPAIPETWRGWLQAANDPTPKNGCLTPAMPSVAPMPENTPLVIIGQTGLPIGKEQKNLSVLSVFDCKSLVLTRTNEGLKISAPIYTKSGELLGEIKDNGYTITKDASLIVEHTGDLSTLIVHDKMGKEMLYVKYSNDHAIKVRGTFLCPLPNGGVDGIVASEDGIFYARIKITMSGLNCLGAGQAVFCINCR